MRLKLYLDTSVLGALTDPGPEERLVATRGLLEGLAKGLMVNIERKRRINSVNLREGLPLVDLVSPWEVSYEEA